MKIHVLSDLHLEHASFDVPKNVESDIVVLAGDIFAPGIKAVRWCQRESTFGGRTVILVPGNHEFYGRVLQSQIAQMREAAAGSNVHVLDKDVLTLPGFRILATTLWTDFRLPFVQPSGAVESNVEGAMAAANRRLNDFQEINWRSTRSDGSMHSQQRRFTAEDSLELHKSARGWLETQLTQPYDGHTIVITHHAPSVASVNPSYLGESSNPAFVSDLPDLMFAGVGLWIHGHTHSSTDHWRNGCRVVSNPRGYRLNDGSFENGRFDPRLVIDMERVEMVGKDK